MLSTKHFKVVASMNQDSDDYHHSYKYVESLGDNNGGQQKSVACRKSDIDFDCFGRKADRRGYRIRMLSLIG